MKDIIVGILIMTGSLFILLASIGLIRFRDLLSRMHATTKATSFGILLLIIGVSISFNVPVVYIKAILILIFIYLTAPLAAHAIAKSSEEIDNE